MLMTLFFSFFSSMTHLCHWSIWNASQQPRRSLPEHAEGGTGSVDWLSLDCLRQHTTPVPDPVVMSPSTATAVVGLHVTKTGKRGQALLLSRLELLTARLLTHIGECVSPYSSNIAPQLGREQASISLNHSRDNICSWHGNAVHSQYTMYVCAIRLNNRLKHNNLSSVLQVFMGKAVFV